MKRVLVILVTHNGMHWLPRCLASVAPSGKKADFPDNHVQTGSSSGKKAVFPDGHVSTDVYVVDNDSTDGSADWIQANYPSAKLVRSAENLGFTLANNLGFDYAIAKGYDYVYLLNQDAWVEEGAIEKLVAAAEAHPEYAVLSPLQMTDGYKEYDNQFAKLMTVPEGIHFLNRRFATPPTAWAPPSYDAEGGTDSGSVYPPEPISIPRVMAAHWLMRMDAVKKVGKFSELFRYYGQDDDWCNRARFHGYKIGILPQARAVHDRAQRKEAKDRIIDRNYRVGSLVRLCNINRPLWERFLYVILFTIVKAVKYFSFKPIGDFFAICKQMPEIKEIRKNNK